VMCPGKISMTGSRTVDTRIFNPGERNYSAPEFGALIEASERVCELESLAIPAISVVRSHAGKTR
jgi:hypothetical protein